MGLELCHPVISILWEQGYRSKIKKGIKKEIITKVCRTLSSSGERNDEDYNDLSDEDNGSMPQYQIIKVITDKLIPDYQYIKRYS